MDLIRGGHELCRRRTDERKVIYKNRYVDIRLYRADSGALAKEYKRIETASGNLNILPDDSWLFEQSSFETGVNKTWTYYFTIVDAGAQLGGAESHQSTFSMIREPYC